MKIPKYSCSVCRKPARKLAHWNRWQKGAINQKENSRYIRPDLMKQFLSSNESNDRKPFDYLHTMTEAFLKGAGEKMAAYVFQPI